MISPKLVDYIAQVHSYSDTLEGQLQLALENGRVARLMMKLGFINERNDASETGDAYIVKLFRDHVFHQVDAEGKPLIDLAHVLYNLNKVSSLLIKLDAFCDDRILLMSRDEQSCLIVSYREVATCVMNSYNDLLQS